MAVSMHGINNISTISPSVSSIFSLKLFFSVKNSGDVFENQLFSTRFLYLL